MSANIQVPVQVRIYHDDDTFIVDDTVSCRSTKHLCKTGTHRTAWQAVSIMGDSYTKGTIFESDLFCSDCGTSQAVPQEASKPESAQSDSWNCTCVRYSWNKTEAADFAEHLDYLKKLSAA